jgi:farnesyl diphosphate synthase
MGARAGHLDPPVLGQLGRYAEAIGLAFQIVDDILDVESSSAEMGKTVGKDQAQNKSTYVSVLGMAAAKQRAAQLRDVAGLALEQTGLGPVRTMRMAQLADLIVARRN